MIDFDDNVVVKTNEAWVVQVSRPSGSDQITGGVGTRKDLNFSIESALTAESSEAVYYDLKLL